MRAITIEPGIKHGARLREVEQPTPKDNEVFVKVREAGVCRTDLEIYNGFYGELPKESKYMIMGHESIGRVGAVGTKVTRFKRGDYVARTVRRPCKDMCTYCSNKDNDFCITGNYTEIGIKGLHGIMTEYYTENPDYLVKVPCELKNIGVLMEPLSFSEKAIRQSFAVQERIYWQPSRALVLGAGPIGLLETMILRSRGLETYVAARSRPQNLRSELVEQLGAHYISLQETKLEKIGKFDLVIESSGSIEVTKEAFNLVGTNGVLCLTSITGGKGNISLPLEQINLNMVLGNKTIIGVVNANIQDYKQGIEDMFTAEDKWPGLLSRLITRRTKPEQYAEAFEHRTDDIKTVIEF